MKTATVYYAVAAGDSSEIYCANTAGHHSRLFTLESNGPLLGLFWYEAKCQLVSIARTGDLCIHGEEEDGKGWQRTLKIKIGGGAAADGPALMVAWVGNHTLASASGRDDVVRMYDLDTEDNYILRIGTCSIKLQVGELNMHSLTNQACCYRGHIVTHTMYANAHL